MSSSVKISVHTKKFLDDISAIIHFATKLIDLPSKISPSDFTKINHTIIHICHNLDLDTEFHSSPPDCSECAKIIHELKSSLSIISILVELMLKKIPPPDSSIFLSLAIEINRTQKLISQAKNIF